MPELRTDWLTGRTVLIAENRAHRPNDFAGEVALAAGQVAPNKTLPTCPFCTGNESRTPAPVYEKLNDRGHWQVRVVANMFAAVETDVPTVIPKIASSPADAQRVSTATGAHEVIIECPTHLDRLSALSVKDLHCVLEAYAARLAHWRNDGQLRYGLVFKNQGPRAGASIAHLHSQLIALPFVPAAVEAEQQRAAESYSRDRLCPYCQIVTREQTTNERIILPRWFHRLLPLRKLATGRSLADADGSRSVVRVGVARSASTTDKRSLSPDQPARIEHPRRRLQSHFADCPLDRWPRRLVALACRTPAASKRLRRAGARDRHQHQSFGS